MREMKIRVSHRPPLYPNRPVWTSAFGLLAASWLHADAQVSAFPLVELEGAGLAHEIAELAKSVGPGIEVGREVGQLRSESAKRNPAVLTVHLRDDLSQHRCGGTWRLERFRRVRGIAVVGYEFGQQVLGVGEPPAGLPETLGCLLLTKAEDIDPLLPDS